MRKLGMVLLVLACWCFRPCLAHEAGHTNYTNWTNQNKQNCCNGEDCNPIPDAKVKYDGKFPQVFIEGKWCPVEPWMYLKTGNAPDWSTAHVCVRKDYSEWEDARSPASDPCSRLLCFQPQPGG
jgi:hypothetical protein